MERKRSQGRVESHEYVEVQVIRKKKDKKHKKDKKERFEPVDEPDDTVEIHRKHRHRSGSRTDRQIEATANESSDNQDDDNQAAKEYEAYQEPYMIQGTNTCAVMTKMREADRVLEVGCGPGLGSVMIAQNYLKAGGVLISTDINFGMMYRYNKHYTRSDFAKVKQNKFIFEDEINFAETTTKGTNTQLKYLCDIEQIVKAQGSFQKIAYGCQADAVELPFPDESFDSYICNMVAPEVATNVLNDAPVVSTTDRDKKLGNMVREAYRVLRPGRFACFTYYSAFWDKKNPTAVTATDGQWLHRIVYDALTIAARYTVAGAAGTHKELTTITNAMTTPLGHAGTPEQRWLFGGELADVSAAGTDQQRFQDYCTRGQAGHLQYDATCAEFASTKVWEQRINITFKSFNEYWDKMGRKIYTELLTKIAANDAVNATVNSTAVGGITPAMEANFRAQVETLYTANIVNPTGAAAAPCKITVCQAWKAPRLVDDE